MPARFVACGGLAEMGEIASLLREGEQVRGKDSFFLSSVFVLVLGFLGVSSIENRDIQTI